MKIRTVFLGIFATAILGLSAACASAPTGPQNVADYQNLIQRADRLAQANQELNQAIEMKDEQVAILKQELIDTQNLTSVQGDMQQKLVILSKERDQLKQQLLDSQKLLAKLQAANLAAGARVKEALDQLKAALKPEIAANSVIIREYQGTILIEVTANITFAADSVILKPDFEKVLLKLAAIFKLLPEKTIRIGGHTATFENDQQQNSWELAAARAIKVTRFLQTSGNLDPERMVVISYGRFWPEAPNDTESNRVKNRVVSFALLDRNFYLLNDLQRISMQ